MDPQITVVLLSDANRFPLMLLAFEGNNAETKTMLPTLRWYKDTCGLRNVVIVADAGMVSEANMDAIEAAGTVLNPGHVDARGPYVLERWRKAHPNRRSSPTVSR